MKDSTSKKIQASPKWYFAIFAVFYLVGGCLLMSAPYLFLITSKGLYHYGVVRIVVGLAELIVGILCIFAAQRDDFQFRMRVGVVMSAVAGIISSITSYTSIVDLGDYGRLLLWGVIFALHLHYIAHFIPTYEFTKIIEGMAESLQEDGRKDEPT